jgi:pyruvate,water dikinase
MAETVASHPELLQVLQTRDAAASVGAIRRIPRLSRKYDEYLAKFGERCLEELKLESPTLHDDPWPLLSSLAQLAQGTRTAATLSPATLSTCTAEQRVNQALVRHPLRRVVFKSVLRNARERIRGRENLRFERTRVFGRVRRVFLEIGRRMHELALLDNPRDIFYLQVEEVLGFVSGTAVTPSLKELVALRKREWEEIRRQPAPADRFETYGPVYHGHTFQSEKNVQDGASLGEERQGLGSCPGRVRGRVFVVRDPHVASLPAGGILVAERTDPGWITLFATAAGLIVERGSLLSHSAIVSRELGIPSVVSIPGITQWLCDGDVVELDGGKGTVRRLRSESAHA